MMGLGYLGSGGLSSSSSSSLSPLAPPFTVDRSNHKSNLIPLTNFTKPPPPPPPPYSVPFSSSLHNWQYPHSSASRPDIFSTRVSEIDSVCTSYLPSASDYCYFGSESINPLSAKWDPPNSNATNPTNPFSCAPNQYYPPYASQVIDDDTSLMSLGEANYDLLSTSGIVPMTISSQVDYAQGLPGFESPPPWVGSCWNELVEGKQSKRTEADGCFRLEDSVVYKDHMKRGAFSVDFSRKCEENPGISLRKYDDFLGKEYTAGSVGKGKLNDSFLMQNIGSFPFESSKAPVLGSGIIFTESHPESPSLEPATFSYNSQKSYSPYEDRLLLFDSFTNDGPSVTKSSLTPVIRPPTFGTKPSVSDVSSKSVDVGNVPHSFTSTIDSAEDCKHTSNSSESLDHHNTSEDSPCWKGAPASHVSRFETLEAMPPQYFSKKSEAFDGLNFRGAQMLPPYSDSIKACSKEVFETGPEKENLGQDNNISRSFYANSPAKECAVANAARASSNKVQFLDRIDSVDKPLKEYGLLNGSKGDSGSLQFNTNQKSPKEVEFTSKRKLKMHTRAVDVGSSSTSDTSDGCVPLHAVEKVLCSTSSGEDDVKPDEMDSGPIMNVQMLVNLIHNLSEVLLSHCSIDARALKEQDCKTLKRAITNIDLCLSKKIVWSTETREPIFPGEGVSQILEEVPNLHMGANAVGPYPMNEIGTASHGQLDSHCTLEQKRKCDASGKKLEKNLDFVSSWDDADFRRHHNIVQDIKKAVVENFKLEEEIPSETLLYKNLWLEAEAELCSVGLRVRSDRVKIQMDNCKPEKAKENRVKLPCSNVFPDLNIPQTSTSESNDSPREKPSVQYSCISSPKGRHISSPKSQHISSPTNHVEDVETLVMRRFHILKRRGCTSDSINAEDKQLPEVVDAGFSGRINQMASKKFDVAVGPRFQHYSGHNDEVEARFYPDDPQLETLKEFHVRARDDLTIQPYNRLQDEVASGSGWYDKTAASDWEHVLKDDFAWQN